MTPRPCSSEDLAVDRLGLAAWTAAAAIDWLLLRRSPYSPAFVPLLLGCGFKTGTAGSFLVCFGLAALWARGRLAPAEASPFFGVAEAKLRPLTLLAAHAALVACFLSLRPPSLQGETPGSAFLWQLLGLAATWTLGSALLSAWRAKPASSLAWAASVLALGLAACGLIALLQAASAPVLIRASLWAASRGLSLFVPGVLCRLPDQVIGIRPFQIMIDIPCSGVESLGLMGAICGLFWIGFRERLEFPKAFAILPIALAILWAANAARIMLLVCVGRWISAGYALEGFHSSTGWLLFDAVAITCIWACVRSPLLGSGFLRDSRLLSESATPYLAPLLATLFTAFLSPPVGDFNRFYPLWVASTAVTLYCFRRSYRGLIGDWSWQAAGCGALTFLIWQLKVGDTGAARASRVIVQALDNLPSWQKHGWLACRAFGACFTVPLSEELAFRGFLARWLLDHDFERVPVGRYSTFSLGISSLAFGLLHRRWIAGTAAGLIFGLAAARRRRLEDAIVAHVVANVLLMAVVYVTGNWALI